MIGAGVLLLIVSAGPVAAGHNPTKTSKCTYEFGANGDAVAVGPEDLVGVTQDGVINLGACGWTFPDSDPGGEDIPLSDMTGKSIQVSGEYTVAQVALVDDIFGTAVGGTLLTDADHDGIHGEEEEGELSMEFCGQSPTFESDRDYDGDGHDDFGFRVLVFFHSGASHVMFCDPVANPVGATTGGILNPSGGAYMKLGG